MPITTELTTEIGKVRYLIGDDIDGAGVLPSGANYSDAQISYELEQVGSAIAATAARMCGNLARRWAIVPQSFSADGLSVNRGEMVKKWSDMQAAFETEALGGNISTITLDRQDAYSVYAGQSGDDLERGDGAE